MCAFLPSNMCDASCYLFSPSINNKIFNTIVAEQCVSGFIRVCVCAFCPFYVVFAFGTHSHKMHVEQTAQRLPCTNPTGNKPE